MRAVETMCRSPWTRMRPMVATSLNVQWRICLCRPRDEPHGKKLKNEDPIYEIRYQAFNRQERALGFFDEDGGVFVIVLICYHKGRIYTPPNAIDTAHRRISQIRDHTATTAPLQIFGEDFPPHE